MGQPSPSQPHSLHRCAHADLYEPSMLERGIRLHLDSCGTVRISGDEGPIHRMVANLFDNELKHLGSGAAVTVQLAVDPEPQQPLSPSGGHPVDAPCAVLIVRDNGAGFSPQVRQHLFAGRVKNRNSTGHGLGLAFVDAVVRAHSGSVTPIAPTAAPKSPSAFPSPPPQNPSQ